MTDLTKPLDDEVLEMAAQIHFKAFYIFINDLSYCRERVLEAPESSRALVAEARKQLRVDELREALYEILNYSGGADNALDDPYVMERARTLLAATEPRRKL